jgi:hypothetical protein
MSDLNAFSVRFENFPQSIPESISNLLVAMVDCGHIAFFDIDHRPVLLNDSEQ